MRKMIDTLCLPYTYDFPLGAATSFIQKIEKANQILYAYFLSSNMEDSISPDDIVTGRLYEFLASEGAILYCGENNFKVFVCYYYYCYYFLNLTILTSLSII